MDDATADASATGAGQMQAHSPDAGFGAGRESRLPAASNALLISGNLFPVTGSHA